jgi:hypothetical protein
MPMNEFLFGRLHAVSEALGIEVNFLSEQDEDTNVRVVKLAKALDQVVEELISKNLPPTITSKDAC